MIFKITLKTNKFQVESIDNQYKVKFKILIIPYYKSSFIIKLK